MKVEESSSGVRFPVRVQPRASRNELAGGHGDGIKVRITAAPVDGEANEALIAFLAKKMGVAKSALSVVSGETSRDKVIEVTGTSVADVREALGGG